MGQEYKVKKLWNLYWLLLVSTFATLAFCEPIGYGLIMFILMSGCGILLNYESNKLTIN